MIIIKVKLITECLFKIISAAYKDEATLKTVHTISFISADNSCVY